MRKILLIFIFFVLIGCSVNKNNFTDIIIKSVENNTDYKYKEISGDYLIFKSKSNNTLKYINFSNYYRYITIGTYSEKECISIIINNFNESNDTGFFIPVLRSKDFYIQTMKQYNDFKLSGFNKITIKINDEIYLFYVDDQKDQMRYLVPEDFNNININNYSQYTNQLLDKMNYKINIENNIFSVTLDNNYESSLILSSNFINIIKSKAGGNVLIGLPSRNKLFFININDKDKILYFKDYINKIFHQEAYQISNKIFFIKNDKISIYQ